jgi:hypothetical protein
MKLDIIKSLIAAVVACVCSALLSGFFGRTFGLFDAVFLFSLMFCVTLWINRRARSVP